MGVIEWPNISDEGVVIFDHFSYNFDSKGNPCCDLETKARNTKIGVVEVYSILYQTSLKTSLFVLQELNERSFLRPIVGFLTWTT